MSFERLLNDKKIEIIEKTEFKSESFEKSMEFANKGMETENYDEILSLVYNNILKVCNKLMNLLGYRAIGKEHHKNTFEFLKQIKLNQEFVNYFDDIRKKRNDFVYRDISNVSKEEAQEVIEKAKIFVHEIRTFVHKNRTRK